MRLPWTLLWHPDATRASAWTSRCNGEVLRAGELTLAAETPLAQTVDGKAVGVWRGVVFNPQQVAAPLLGRGAPIADDTSLVLHAVGWSGLQGLGALRWHGTVAVVQRAQRTALVARDWQGVGGLYWASDGDGHVFSTDRHMIEAAGLPARLVPPGMLALCAPNGVRWQAIPSAADARAWFRDLPDELDAPTPEVWRAGLHDRLRHALEICAQLYPGLAFSPPQDPVGQWLAEQYPLAATREPRAIWALDGASAWLGLSSAEPLPDLPGPWPRPEPPEPLRVDDQEARARAVRATWLADVALETARQRANAQNIPLVAPHLDPAVLAWLGAMPRVLRPFA